MILIRSATAWVEWARITQRVIIAETKFSLRWKKTIWLMKSKHVGYGSVVEGHHTSRTTYITTRYHTFRLIHNSSELKILIWFGKRYSYTVVIIFYQSPIIIYSLNTDNWFHLQQNGQNLLSIPTYHANRSQLVTGFLPKNWKLRAWSRQREYNHSWSCSARSGGLKKAYKGANQLLFCKLCCRNQ